MKILNQSQLLKLAIKMAICVSLPLFAVNTAYAENTAQELWQTAYSQYHQGNPQACYQTLQSLDYMLGEVTYDRLLGLCAQGAGNNSQALLAYNRIMAQQEQNAEIRLERARVLYNLSLLSESRLEFNKLLAQNPPPAASKVIQNYLSAIANRTAKINAYSRLKVSTSLGHDDNVNSASELNEFLGFTLNDNSRAASSTYAGVNLLAEHQFKLAHNTGLKFSAGLGKKHHPDAEFVDQDLMTIGAGFTKAFNNSVINLDLLNFRQSVDSSFNSRGALLKATFSKVHSSTISTSTYFTGGALRYAINLAAKDVNKYSIGNALIYSPKSLPDDTFTVDLSLGHDYPLFINSNYEADFGALKLSHAHEFRPNIKSRATLEYKKYNYDNPFFALAFPDARTDDTLAANVSLDWDISKKFNLSPSFAYRDNNSNVDLFSYNRWYAQIKASYQWIW